MIGGDGFMLWALKKYNKYKKPFYGINSGNYGFLMNKFSKKNTIKNLSKARVVSISPLQMIVKNKSNFIKKFIAINEISILSQTIEKIKQKFKTKFALWYEDYLIKGGPNAVNNLNLIEKNEALIDQYFVTTHPGLVKTLIPKEKMNFLPIPADVNIENLEIYNSANRYKDLFFALSHGVNYGKLKPRNFDEREIFLNELLNKNNKFTFNLIGYAHEQPKWNYQFFSELSKCKMALNLSRGKTIKYYSSNRIASLVANGIMTFIDEKTKYADFFNTDEMGFYTNFEDRKSVV